MKKHLLALALGATMLTGCAVESGQVTDTGPDADSSGVAADLAPTGTDVSDHAAVTGCGYSKEDEYGVSFFRAEVSLKNKGAEPASYYVTVSFDGADGARLGDSLVAVEKLGTGQVAVEDAPWIDMDTPPEGTTCTILEVTRSTF